MKYRVKGPRVLIEVKKFSGKDQTYKGTSIVMAESVTHSETTGQCVGRVVELGNTAYKRKDSGCDGTSWCEVGDVVHFSRYGAIRLESTKEAEIEHWVINDKDVLVVEETKENVI